MSRYDAMFDRLRAANEGAFGAFLMLGDPDKATSARLLAAAADGGADMIEVGIPYSDPIADGPVIQRAAQRALAAGARVDDAFDLIRDFRAVYPDVPVGILTYANLVIARGLDRFCADAAAAGADSLLVADVPSLEAAAFSGSAKAANLDFVMIAAPNTPAAVLERIAALSSGYTYCVARAGVTGTSDALTLDHDALFAGLKAAGAPPPVLGFGISSPAQVTQALSAGAAGVIAGSAIVRLIEDEADAAEPIRDFVASMKAATARA